MKTLVVDTNIFLRFLTNDVPSQAKKVEIYFKKALQGKVHLKITLEVVVEIIFHLEHWYGYSKIEAVDKVLSLFSPEWMDVSDKSILFESLNIYKKAEIDFVDILLYVRAKSSNCNVLSFDKDYDSLDYNIRVEP